MEQTAMTVRMDKQLKNQFDTLCEEFGMSANTAINVFIRSVVRTRRIPFTISAAKDTPRSRALDTFYATQSRQFEDLPLDEINQEISLARQERKQRTEL